jgi:hypothetical protein
MSKATALTARLATNFDEVHAVDGGYNVEQRYTDPQGGSRVVQTHYILFGDSRDDDSPPSLSPDPVILSDEEVPTPLFTNFDAPSIRDLDAGPDTEDGQERQAEEEH